MGKPSRFIVSCKPTEDGFAEFLVVEKSPTGEDIVVARCQHHLTPKAKKLAELFVQLSPAPDGAGMFEMVLLGKQTVLSVAKDDKEGGGHMFWIGQKSPGGRFRIHTGGATKLEGDMWRSVGLRAADAFQESGLRPKWAAQARRRKAG